MSKANNMDEFIRENQKELQNIFKEILEWEQKQAEKEKHKKQPCTMPTCDGCMINNICDGIL